MTQNKWVKAWLWVGILMVLVQVSIGGITRLTDSGLSMTTWEPIKGALPPLSEEAWVAAFDDYRRYPEYYQKNADFTLAEFKGIYWWEYIHRAWARLIGLVFFFPFVAFLVKGWIDRKLGLALVGVVLLGAAQAAMGWIMVMSGMDDNPWVSPYRLTAHLFLALALFAWLYRMVLPANSIGGRPRDGHQRFKTLLWVLTALVLVQIAYGGLVAGSDAARHFNTWPDMNGELVPAKLFKRGLEWQTVRHNSITPQFIVNTQFIHRTLALVVLATTVLFWWRTRNALDRALLRGANALLLVVLLQVSLGIGTILLSNPQRIHLELGVLHQLCAFLLVGVLVFLHRSTAPVRADGAAQG
jgi:cytochrome c oxidase assembly protein subunit 15